MKPMKWLSALSVLALVALASGCGGGSIEFNDNVNAAKRKRIR